MNYFIRTWEFIEVKRFLSIKCEKTVKNAHNYFPEKKVTSSNCFFFQTNSPKLKHNIYGEKWHRKPENPSIYEEKKQQMFCLNMTETI